MVALTMRHAAAAALAAVLIECGATPSTSTQVQPAAATPDQLSPITAATQPRRAMSWSLPAWMNKPNFQVEQVPTGHALLVNRTGLLVDDDRSAGLAPQLVATIRAWLNALA